MDIDWPAEFGRWLDRLDADHAAGDQRATTIREYVAAALSLLRDLTEAPAGETERATLRPVRQSRRYQLWRVSHPYHPGVAVRLICWFPPKATR